MDKYEYKVKLAQIEKMVAKKDYVTAAKIADGIDWRKVKSVTTLTMIADIYEETDRLEDCYEILNMVYDRSPIGRGVVYRLAEIATKMHDFEDAIDLYKEFVRIAPHDLSKYILKYQIYRERGSSVADQIAILEEFKSHEYDEKWGYELASLYEEAGMIDRCIEECDELILWFSEGEYVVKAMELKMKHQELTASQKEKYDRRFEYQQEAEEEAEEDEYFDEEDAQEDVLEEQPEETSDVKEHGKEEVLPEKEETIQDSEAAEEEEDDTPQVSVINTNKFSTLNLQAELAKELRTVLAQEEAEASEAEKAEKEGDTQKFFSEKKPIEKEEKVLEEVTPQPVEAEKEEETSEQPVEAEKEEETSEQPAKAAKTESLSETAELQTEILKYAAAPPQRKMEEMLRIEEDGQISLAIGDENILEKQITGQMTIEEILEAWEEKKRQARKQIEKAGEKKQAVLFETGEITKVLQDFIPRTPKDVQQIIEEIEGSDTEIKAEAAAKIPEAETLTAEAVAEIPEAEAATEIPEAEAATEETEAVLAEPEQTAPKAEEPDSFEELERLLQSKIFGELEQLEDDLPQDIEMEEKTLPQNTASMLDAIEKALAMEITPAETSGKYLTEEQEKIFAYFTSVDGMKKQLAQLLEEDSIYAGIENSKIGNLIITGHPGNGKTTLAIDIVKAFQKQRQEKGGKLAKVSGDGLNKKDPAEVVQKLGGGALIIERAGALNSKTVKKLSEAMEGNTGGLLVILEDDAGEIKNLLEKHSGFAEKFNRSIDIPIFSNDELVAFGKSYAEEQEYFFDEMAVLALYDSIGVRQTADHVVNITEVKEFVDSAIEHAEKKSRGIFARLSKKRIDEYGNKLLLEEDFEV